MTDNMFTDRRVILAPMAGVGDEVFRQLCIEQGAQLTYTEMVSAKALSYANEKTAHLLDLAPNEDKVSVQLFGHEPATMAEQAKWVEDSLGSRLFAIGRDNPQHMVDTTQIAHNGRKGRGHKESFANASFNSSY